MFNLGQAFANVISVPAGIGRIGVGALRSVGRLGTGIGAGLAAGFAGPDLPAATVTSAAAMPSRTRRASVATSPEANEYLQPARSAAPQAQAFPAIDTGRTPGGWRAVSMTRDQIGPSTTKARQISLDFNDADNPSARGIEIVIPDDATPAERAAAQAYVERTQAYFAKHGVEVPIRGVRTRSENGRGTKGRFHTEPFFVRDAASRAVMQTDPAGYASVLAETLGTIPGATFIAPHTSTDPGATLGDLNERDFAKSAILPALMQLQSRPTRERNPPNLMQMQTRPEVNPFLVPPTL